jgi:AcrR family transcriptional regulator
MAPRTPKGERTREEILDAAIRLFGERGFERTTLRAIADEAGVSLGLTYRYFDGKDALVVALYARLTEQFVARLDALPEGRWVDRARFALDASFDVLGPHREVLSALTGAAGSNAPDAMHAPVVASRDEVRAGFVRAVCGATDAPRGGARLGEALYLAHLGLLLFWLLDRSPDQEATRRLRAWGAAVAPQVGFLLALPVVGGVAAELIAIVSYGVYGVEPREEAS